MKKILKASIAAAIILAGIAGFLFTGNRAPSFPQPSTPEQMAVFVGAAGDTVVSCWKLDEASGNAVDTVGGVTLTNNSVTYSNTAPTISNNYAVFNGAADLVNTAAFSWTQGSTHSVSVWMYYTSTSSQASVGKVSNTGNGWYLGTEGTLDRIRTGISDLSGDAVVDTSGMSAMSQNAWHHIVMTTTSLGTATSTHIYVDNVDQTVTQAASGTISPLYTGVNFALGSRNSSTKYLSGREDEVGIWDRALTPTEVSQLYNSGAGLACPFTGGGTTGKPRRMIIEGMLFPIFKPEEPRYAFA